VRDDLTEDRIAAELRGHWGRPLMVLPSTGSTNDEALKWAAEGAPEGTLVVAEDQTRGRGRRERSWWSEPGRSLLFSLILRPRRPAAELGLLTAAVGVAAARGVEEATDVRIALKWPNDLVVGDRKLGGILVETRVTASGVDVAVAGVGINVFDLSEAPADIAARSTSIAAELPRGSQTLPERAHLVASILAALEELYPALDPRIILKEATLRSVLLGRRVRVDRADGTALEGLVVSLLPTGAIEIETEGERIAINSGEVTALRYGSS
jgi:BirA family transcriptional regulator, biotin operon repressor / biotin---[acetyl-CoA-carboxylase] ligase